MDRLDQSDWTKDDLIGGHSVLDFLNTAGGQAKQRDVERLTDFSTFLKWSIIANILSQPEAEAVRRCADDNPAAADASLTNLIGFREALHGCLMAEQADREWPVQECGQVMGAIRAALVKAQLEKDDKSYGWTVPYCKPDLVLPMMRIVLATETLLRSDDLARMRNCDGCSWLFIDRGRGRARRWCSMAACGSRAKSARYYKRQTKEKA